MSAERCEQCGFDGEAWTDEAAMDAIGRLPAQWREVTTGIEDEVLQRRHLPDTWSIAEYADHVREVLFGMRFLLDSAVERPGVDLGDSPEPQFTPTARSIDVSAAVSGIETEAVALVDRLAQLGRSAWDSTAVVGGEVLDAHWICRHAVHDATHHLDDVGRLRAAAGRRHS